MEDQISENIMTCNKLQNNYSKKRRKHESMRERQDREFRKLPDEWKKSINEFFDQYYEEIKLQIKKETKEQNKNEQL